MSSKTQRRVALRRKLHILKTLTNSKSVKKSSIIMDAFLYIYKLKLQVEAIQREYQYLINHIQEVKVEKDGTRYVVRVTCKKGQDLLVSIIEAFEEMNLNVLEARVTTKHFFGMEAIAEAKGQDIDSRILTETILNVIQRPTGNGAIN
ncbi:uncharacterized protein LOC111370292 [Olea europaea var. sylvestris]|uniref:uncharacterized protein LOC111370292 n=1 Tax=Olea europaea var. sylvestris TaxID=158386 RepID=UPI000C1CD6E0|nr:uncharacterized protein LOC111370292 [Olea europaea var. sylvestris]